METAIILVLTFVACVIIACILDKNEFRWIPVILTEGPEIMNLKEIPYRINFTETFPIAWQGPTATGSLDKIKDRTYQMYIVWGDAFKYVKLQDGRELSLTEGDCIIVDPSVTEKGTYKAYLVNPYPEYSAYKDVKIKTSDDVAADDNILGAIVASIPAWWMDQRRK